MKNYLKNELKHLPMIIIVSIIFCGINTLANNHLFDSKDVDYDNSNTHIESTNVGDAIDELFDAANNFTTYDTRLQGVETKVGTGTLNTTAQNLIGSVNELNNNLGSPSSASRVTGVNAFAKINTLNGKITNLENAKVQLMYSGSPTYTNGAAIIPASSVAFIGYVCSSWINANAISIASAYPNGSIRVLLPESTGFSGSLSTRIYGFKE